MQRVKPALRVAEYEKSRNFYPIFGSEVDWTQQFEPGLPIVASLSREAREIFLTEHTGDCGPGGLVHFSIPDGDANFQMLKKLDVKIAQPPKNTLRRYLRDVLVVDPDGNQLSFLTLAGDLG